VNFADVLYVFFCLEEAIQFFSSCRRRGLHSKDFVEKRVLELNVSDLLAHITG